MTRLRFVLLVLLGVAILAVGAVMLSPTLVQRFSWAPLAIVAAAALVMLLVLRRKRRPVDDQLPQDFRAVLKERDRIYRRPPH